MAPEDEDTTVIPAVVVPPVVIEETPETISDQTAALEAIGGRIEAVETRITEGLEGEREWTLETITFLRQEIADLKANLSEITTGFPAQVQALRDELTQLSQSLQTPVVAAVVEEPPIPVVEPESELPASVEGTPEAATAKNALQKGRRRVV